MSGRRYGSWAGKPDGYVEDPARCVASVYPPHTVRSVQCGRKRGKGAHGDLCGTHARIERMRGRGALRIPEPQDGDQ